VEVPIVSDLVFVERGTPEWARVWDLLAASTGGDTIQRCPCCGEMWQYMGSFRTENTAYGTHTAHEFRHRHCPTTAQREYRRFTDRGSERIDPTGAAHELRPIAALLSPRALALLSLVTGPARKG
jgi:hypothetical protein